MDTENQRELAERYDKYGAMLYRLCLVMLCSRQDAEDAVQETFFAYLRYRPEFADTEHEKAWFLRVATNKCHDLRRSPFWKRRADWEGVDLTEETPEEIGVLEELMHLPGKYREVIHLHYIEGYKVAEIAQMLGRRESTVKVQLHRGRELLRLNLEERGIEP